MHKLDQKGDVLLVPFIVVMVFLVGSLAFGVWAFMGMQDYKNNTDKKIAEAVEIAEADLTAKKDAEFAEAYKLPYSTYRGPAAFGSLTINYPRTWSNYVVDKTGGTPIDGYMQPVYVSSNNKDTNYALRYQILERQYDQVIKTFDSGIKNGKVTAEAFRLPSMESELGLRIKGQIDTSKQGDMVVVKLRDKTIKIWTEGTDFRSDFENILKELTFIP